MVRSKENPTPIDFENIDLDEFFQLNRQRSPVAHQAPAVGSSSILSFPLDILTHLLAIQDVGEFIYFRDIELAAH